MSHEAVMDGQIINIVQNQEIFEQSDLQQRLKDRGYEIPQATLSRRLKKLRIAKVAGIYKVVDFQMPNLPLVLNIEVSEFGLIVLQTNPGNANNLGYYFDQKFVTYNPRHPKKTGIIGTIAGDDTVLLIVKGKSYLAGVLQLLQEEFPYLQIDEGKH